MSDLSRVLGEEQARSARVEATSARLSKPDLSVFKSISLRSIFLDAKLVSDVVFLTTNSRFCSLVGSFFFKTVDSISRVL